MGCCVSHQPNNWLYSGLAHWEPVLQGPWQHGKSETGDQVTGKEVFVVADEVLLLPVSPHTTCLRQAGSGKWSEMGARHPANGPRTVLVEGAASRAQPGAVLCCIAPPAMFPKQDTMSLMRCVQLATHQHPRCVMNRIKTGARYSAAVDK